MDFETSVVVVERLVVVVLVVDFAAVHYSFSQLVLAFRQVVVSIVRSQPYCLLVLSVHVHLMLPEPPPIPYRQ